MAFGNSVARLVLANCISCVLRKAKRATLFTDENTKNPRAVSEKSGASLSFHQGKTIDKMYSNVHLTMASLCAISCVL